MSLNRKLSVFCLLAPLTLAGATCGEAVEVASLVANDWLAVTCENNPQSYCDSARALTLSLAARIREQRLTPGQAGLTPLEALVDPSQMPKPRPPQQVPVSEGPGPGMESDPQSAIPIGEGGLQQEETIPEPDQGAGIDEFPVLDEFDALADSAGPHDVTDGMSERGAGPGIDLALLAGSSGDVENGATVSSSDPIRVAFRPLARSFVYVFAVDAWGTVTPLFPPVGATGGNPVTPGRTMVVEADAKGLEQGDGGGIGHVYVSVSDGPRDDLERARAAFITRPRSTTANPARVGTPSVVGSGEVTTRSAPPPLPIDAGSPRTVTPRRYVPDGADQPLVVTRWFRRG